MEPGFDPSKPRDRPEGCRRGHALVDIVVANPTRRDLVECAARLDLVAATDAERRKESHYRDRAAGTIFEPFALETYDALSDRSDRFLVDCATIASRESAGSGPVRKTALVRRKR